MSATDFHLCVVTTCTSDMEDVSPFFSGGEVDLVDRSIHCYRDDATFVAKADGPITTLTTDSPVSAFARFARISGDVADDVVRLIEGGPSAILRNVGVSDKRCAELRVLCVITLEPVAERSSIALKRVSQIDSGSGFAHRTLRDLGLTTSVMQQSALKKGEV